MPSMEVVDFSRTKFSFPYGVCWLVAVRTRGYCPPSTAFQFYTDFWFYTSLLSWHLGKPQSLRLKHVRRLYGFLPSAVPTSSDSGTLQDRLWIPWRPSFAWLNGTPTLSSWPLPVCSDGTLATTRPLELLSGSPSLANLSIFGVGNLSPP